MNDDQGFEALLQAADSDSFSDLMDKINEGLDIKPDVDPDVYKAVFNTTAGRIVLTDMYNRYVNVSRFVPGRDASEGYYREGMAQVVFDIVHLITSEGE